MLVSPQQAYSMATHERRVLQLEAGDDSAGLQLQTCLRKTQAMHKTLVEHAKKHGITVPEADDDDDEEMANVPESFAWPHYVMVGARDWDADMKREAWCRALSAMLRLQAQHLFDLSCCLCSPDTCG